VIDLPQIFNVATYFVDRNILEGRGENVAIECGTDRVTYQKLFVRTNRAGNALRNLNVRPGDRVLLLLLDCPEFLYCFFGAIKIGAIAIPVNTQAKPHDYEYMLNDSRAEIAIVSASLLPQVQAIPKHNLPHLREIILVGDIGSARTIPNSAI
jgi:acyl-coenzyme A synthetase/AMP-(fatty) acid ligase